MSSVTVLMFGKMDNGTKWCNQRIDQRWSKGISLADTLDKRLTEQENNSRILGEENVELKKMFDELQIEEKNASKKLVLENTILKNKLEELQKKVENFEAKSEGLQELHGEQTNTSKKLVQENISPKELPSKIGNLKSKL